MSWIWTMKGTFPDIQCHYHEHSKTHQILPFRCLRFDARSKQCRCEHHKLVYTIEQRLNLRLQPCRKTSGRKLIVQCTSVSCLYQFRVVMNSIACIIHGKKGTKTTRKNWWSDKQMLVITLFIHQCFCYQNTLCRVATQHRPTSVLKRHPNLEIVKSCNTMLVM